MKFSMNKFLAMVAGLLLVCSARADSYLYWMLDDVQDPKLEFAFAMIATEVDGERTYLSISESMGTAGSPMIMGRNYPSSFELSSGLAAPYYALLPQQKEGMTFFVELYNWNYEVVGVTEYAALSAVADFIYQDTGTAGVQAPYHFSASIPEPSCGLLVLFGLGLLGLKRRERKFEVWSSKFEVWSSKFEV